MEYEIKIKGMYFDFRPFPEDYVPEDMHESKLAHQIENNRKKISLV